MHMMSQVYSMMSQLHLMMSQAYSVMTQLHLMMSQVYSMMSQLHPMMSQVYSMILFCLVALRPKSTAKVIAGRSVHLTTLFPGQA